MDKANATPTILPAMISRAEICELLGISRGAFVRLQRLGKVPEPIRLSTTLHRWRREDIEAWIARDCNND